MEEKDIKPFDKGIDLKKAKARVLESLAAAEKSRKQSADPAIGWSYEELWYQQKMARYAVSTADTTQTSNYYDPQLYAGIKRLTDRTSKGVFSGGDYFELEPVNINDTVDEKSAKNGKLILEDQLHKAKFKTFAKALIETAGFVDCAIGKVVPNQDYKMVKCRVPVNPEDLSAGFKIVEKKISKQAVNFSEVDILNMYFEDLFVDSLAETNITELIPTTIGHLKELEKNKIYGNISKVKPNAKSSQYITDNFKNQEREVKNTNSNKAVENVLIAEYWGSLDTENGNVEVQIVLAGDQVIRAKYMDFWHGNKPYFLHTYEKVKGLITGMAPSRRLLPTQFAMNQLYNLEIENGMLKGSGALLTDERTGAYIRKQVPKGRWSRGQIVSVKTGSKSLRESIMEVPFADVSSVCENVIERTGNTMSVVLSSPLSFSGQPTGTQLDRTKSGYATAIGEANIAVEQMIYSSQDELIEPALTMAYLYLQEYMTESVTIKSDDGTWKEFSPADLYGLVNVRIFGGSKYLERQEKAAALQQSIEMLKGAPNSIQDIDFGILYSRYLKYMNIDNPEEILREKSAEQVFGELLQKAPPDQIIQWAEIAEQKQKELQLKKMVDQENYEKSRTINTVNIDESYNEALGKMRNKL